MGVLVIALALVAAPCASVSRPRALLRAGSPRLLRGAVFARLDAPPEPEAPRTIIDQLLESSPSSAAAAGLVGDDAASFSLSAESARSWTTFAAAVSVVLGALYVLWIRADTGYADDFVHVLEGVAGGNSLLVNLALGTIFPLVHSGLASLRPAAEPIVGARTWRVIFACASLPLAWTWIMYFIAHRYDGGLLWNLHGDPAVHAAVWIASFISFFFLYPSTFNLLEVAAVDKPQLHLWETGVIRITRHPQLTGQVIWSAAHLAWLGTPFTLETMLLLVAHHTFAAWNGDRRLADKHGPAFETIKERTSVVPFGAIVEGRQQLPADYWKEWVRLPYAVISVAVVGAYLSHPLMQGAAALVQNAGYQPGGLLDALPGLLGS